MFRIRICTPSYDGKISSLYLQSILEIFSNEKIEADYKMVLGDSLVNRARNLLFSDFYESLSSIDYTHMVWIDSDVYASGNGLFNLLIREKDVIAAPVPLKTDQNKFGFIQSVLGVKKEIEDMFYEVEYVSTGFLILSKKAVVDLAEYCEKNNMFYYLDKQKIYDVFRTGSDENNFYMSEDWYLCDLLKKLGYSVYADSSCPVVHFGSPTRSWSRGAIPVNPGLIEKEKLHLNTEENPYWITNDIAYID